MLYHAPYGSVDPNAAYVDHDTPGNVRGSVPPAAAIEMPQREIVDVIAKAGLTPASQLQLWDALRRSFPWSLTANLTLYVRPDGNDANDGSANTAAAAFQTIQAAFNYARRKYILSGYTLTIKLGTAGTYPGLAAKDFSGTVILEGDIAAPQNYIITNQSAIVSPIDCRINTLTVRGVKLAMASVAASRNVLCQTGSIVLDTVVFSSAGAARTDTFHLRAGPGGYIAVRGQCSVDVGARQFIIAFSGSCVEVSSQDATCTLTLVGVPAFASFAQSGESATQYYQNVTFVGTATGLRYNVASGGSIITYGAGASFLPGNAAGTNGGGYYV